MRGGWCIIIDSHINNDNTLTIKILLAMLPNMSLDKRTFYSLYWHGPDCSLGDVYLKHNIISNADEARYSSKRVLYS